MPKRGRERGATAASEAKVARLDAGGAPAEAPRMPEAELSKLAGVSPIKLAGLLAENAEEKKTDEGCVRTYLHVA